MNINQFLKANMQVKENAGGYEYREYAPLVVCVDGFNMSVQVSSRHFCTPRINDADFYSEVEIGYPSETEPLIMEFAKQAEHPTDTIYGYVPVSIVDEVIAKHGGFKLE